MRVPSTMSAVSPHAPPPLPLINTCTLRCIVYLSLPLCMPQASTVTQSTHTNLLNNIGLLTSSTQPATAMHTTTKAADRNIFASYEVQSRGATPLQSDYIAADEYRSTIHPSTRRRGCSRCLGPPRHDTA